MPSVRRLACAGTLALLVVGNGKNPSLSIGTTDAVNEAELLNCLGDFSVGTGTCPWFQKPPKPS